MENNKSSSNDSFGLIGDIGGTNARFALTVPGQAGFQDAMTLAGRDYETIHDAIRVYLERMQVGTPQSICLAIAGRIINGAVKMTNNDWFISEADLSERFPDSRIHLINDFTAIALSVRVATASTLAGVEAALNVFTAIALSIPYLESDQVINVGCSQPHSLTGDTFSIGILGPGTGLGVAGLLKQQGVTIPIVSEAGHISFAPYNQQQDQLLMALRERWPRISVERLVSGSGVENIFWALNRISGNGETTKSAGEIFEEAIANAHSIDHEAVGLFFQIMGQVAGDIALAFGAEDGIYIAGGVAMRYPDLLVSSDFREAFNNKGRHSAMVEATPTYLIIHPQPGLLGASVALFNDS